MIHLALFAILAGEPLTTARTIVAHEEDIIQINTQLGFVTEIHLPKGEVIMTDEEHAPRCGNRTFFQVNSSGNVLYIQPMDIPDGKEGGRRTNIDISLIDGSHMSFMAQEISKTRDGHADLKVFVNRVDQSNIVLQPGAPKYVPAGELALVRSQLEAAQKDEESLRGRLSTDTQQAATEAIAHVTMQYQMYDRKGEDLHARVFRDDLFTHVEITAQELPSVWEIKDGKLSKIEAVYRDGKYTISHLVDEGELRVGKSSIKFKYTGRKS